MTNLELIHAIARRASTLYARVGVSVAPAYIASELDFVDRHIVRLRLQALLDADDSNFAHDIGGIHRHLNMSRERFDDCFTPRYAAF